MDVSGYETLSAADWVTIRNAGRVFGWARSSYGYGGTDSQFTNHMTNGKNAGLYMGAYHFSYPGYSSGNTPINEATTFINAAGAYMTAGHLRPVLDVEWGPGSYMNGLTLTQWCTQFIQYVKQQTGVEPLVYTAEYFAESRLESSMTQYDLWVAYWPSGIDPQTASPAGYLSPWSTWAFWQYAGDTTIPGTSIGEPTSTCSTAP